MINLALTAQVIRAILMQFLTSPVQMKQCFSEKVSGGSEKRPRTIMMPFLRSLVKIKHFFLKNMFILACLLP